MRRISILTTFLFSLFFPTTTLSNEYAVDNDGTTLRLGFEIESTSVRVCFITNGVCVDAEQLNPFVYTASPEDGSALDGPVVAILETADGSRVFVLPQDTSGEWSRGVYVIIGALIGLVSTFGVRMVELAATSVFRRRRAIARLRANLLKVQENLVTEQPVTFSDVVLNLTSYGQVLLRTHIVEIQEVLAKHKMSNLTTAEAAEKLDAIDEILKN